MAINKENEKKSRKPLLIIGLILLFAALFVGGGFLITSSIVFARNATALFLLGGAGVGIGVGVSKGVKSLLNKDSEQSNTRDRSLTRDRSQELERDNEREDEQEKVETLAFGGLLNSANKSNFNESKVVVEENTNKNTNKTTNGRGR